jgi:hypothetical protein
MYTDVSRSTLYTTDAVSGVHKSRGSGNPSDEILYGGA